MSTASGTEKLTTIYVYARGDGSWRVLETFKRALGEAAATLVVHPNRDESGFYGSADVRDPVAARAAFADACRPFPGLKAHLSAPPPEREEPPQRPAAQRPADRGPHHARQDQRHDSRREARQGDEGHRPERRRGRLRPGRSGHQRGDGEMDG